jgi:hypothetical protein
MHEVGHRNRSAKRAAISVGGVISALLLHILFLSVIMWGDGTSERARRPDAMGAGANTGSREGASSERMILIQLSDGISPEESEPIVEPQLAQTLQAESLLKVTGPDIKPPPPLVFKDEGEVREASEADIIARTKMVGMYESQIRARIERAWTRPKDTPDTPPASCLVKIHQRKDGMVEDVIWERCEGSFAWLTSLKTAILAASPLPGPPHPSVFVDTFSMSFKSD